MRRSNFKTLALMTALASAAMLTACGGGGGGDSSATTPTNNTSTGSNTGNTAAPVITPVVTTPVVPATTAGDLSTTIEATTYVAGSVEAEVYAQLNALRVAGGFGTLKQDAKLDAAAKMQSDYAIANFLDATNYWNVAFIFSTNSNTGALEAHSQVAGTSLFVGATAADRAKASGYAASATGEIGVFAFDNGQTAAQKGSRYIQEWTSSIAHRQYLLDPKNESAGVGISRATIEIANNPNNYSLGAYMTFGYTKAKTAPTGWVGIYPLANSTGIPMTGYGIGEVSTGQAPSVNIGEGQLTVQSFTVNKIVGTARQSVQVSVVNSISHPSVFLKNWAFAVPSIALDAASTYEVTFVGADNNGKSINKTWQFTTK